MSRRLVTSERFLAARTRRQRAEMTGEVLADHGHRDVLDTLVEIRLQGFVCPDCGHRHEGEATNYACADCPCERSTPAGLKL